MVQCGECVASGKSEVLGSTASAAHPIPRAAVVPSAGVSSSSSSSSSTTLLQPSRLKNPKAFSYAAPPDDPRFSSAPPPEDRSFDIGGEVKKSLANLQARQKSLPIGNISEVGNPFVRQQSRGEEGQQQHLRAHRWKPKNRDP